MKVGEVFRYTRVSEAKNLLSTSGALPDMIDGLPNFLKVTLASDGTLTTLERGINPIGKVRGPDGVRVPAVLLRSSPHKAGSDVTPWRDHFAPDKGYIRYFGDAKPGQGVRPEQTPGTRVLLEQHALHAASHPEVRAAAAPILAFQGVTADGRAKGQVRFQGLTAITGVERVVQPDPKADVDFVNYRFDLAVLDLSNEYEEFPWSWITGRRNPSLSLRQTFEQAPRSWRRWVEHGLTPFRAFNGIR